MKTTFIILAVGAVSVCAQTLLEAPFKRITEGIIATETLQSAAAAWGDYDGDGWLDLFVGHDSGRNSLFHSNRDGTFAKVTSGPIATTTAAIAHSSSWVDYDNDGWPDLLVTQLTSIRNPLFEILVAPTSS